MRKLLFAFLLFVFTASVAAVPPNQVHLSTTSDPSTSVTVTWQTYSSASTIVELSGGGMPSALHRGSQYQYIGYSGYLHNVTLPLLSPGTTYSYRVGDGVDWSDTFSFTTAPLVGSAVPFTAVVWGDQGFSSTVPSVAAAINPNLTIIAGDLAYSSDEENVDAFFDTLQPLSSKSITMVVPGNHEYNEFGAGGSSLGDFTNRFAFPSNPSYAYLNERAYSINYGNAHFAFLDLGSTAGDEDDEVHSDDVKTWLDADLASVPSGIKWKIVVLHYNFYSISSEHPMTDSQNERARFEPLFRNRGVDLVVSGHVHNYERMYPLADPDVAASPDPANVVYQTSYVDPAYPTYLIAGVGGQCCYDVANHAPWAVSNLQERGYVKLAFSSTGLTEEFHSLNGSLRDTFTISKSRSSTILPYGSTATGSINSNSSSSGGGDNGSNPNNSTPGIPPGTAGNTSTPSTVNSQVDFTLSSPASATILQGSSGSIAVTATQLAGLRSSASLSVSCPATVSCLFSTSANSFNFTSTLFLSTRPTTPTGTYPITVTATSGGVTRTSSVSLSVVSPSTCSENWQCNAFSNCTAGFQNRTCVDSNHCGTAISKPVETIACGQCVETWECTGWGNCAAGLQPRTCTDVANCNTFTNKPVEQIQCAILPSGTPFEPSITQGTPVVAGNAAGGEGNFINSAITSIVSFFSWVTDLFK